MLFRVSQSGRPAFQLRKGEAGISVFDSEAVQPPLTEAEVLANFRSGSIVVTRLRPDVEAIGLSVIPITGAESLPGRLRDAHAEIRPGPGMSRGQLKQALTE